VEYVFEYIIEKIKMQVLFSIYFIFVPNFNLHIHISAEYISNKNNDRGSKMKRHNLLYVFRRELHHARSADIRIKAKINQSFFGTCVAGKMEALIKEDLTRHTGKVQIQKLLVDYEKPEERSKSDGCRPKVWYSSASSIFQVTYFLSTFCSDCEDYLLNLSIYVPVELDDICPGIETYTLANTASKSIPGYRDSLLAVERDHNCFHFSFILETIGDSCQKFVTQADWYVILS